MCKARISLRYPLIEGATAALWVGAALRFKTLEAAAFVALVSSALLALTAIDFEHRRLPNAIVLPATSAAIAWVAGLSFAKSDWGTFERAVVSGIAYFAILFLIAVVSGGMGFGDVKLAGFIGIITGRFDWRITVAAVLIAFIGGGLVAVGLLLFGGRGRKSTMPFGPALAAGAIAALFLGAAPVRSLLKL